MIREAKFPAPVRNDPSEASSPQSPRSQEKQRKQSKVTLSGILNAIDGASAPTGHLLIMTTNHPENLDDALIRPGRVDFIVEFSYATREQIRDVFLKLFKPNPKKPARYDTSLVRDLAKEFADIVPRRGVLPCSNPTVPHETSLQPSSRCGKSCGVGQKGAWRKDQGARV